MKTAMKSTKMILSHQRVIHYVSLKLFSSPTGHPQKKSGKNRQGNKNILQMNQPLVSN
jgi:hypothetical protein